MGFVSQVLAQEVQLYTKFTKLRMKQEDAYSEIKKKLTKKYIMVFAYDIVCIYPTNRKL